MKVSVNWIKEYINFDLPEINELVRKIGAQLGEVEGVEHIGEKYAGVLVVRVVSCADHPNADRLHVCMVDDGGIAQGVERDKDGYVQVVCGAPNVRAGMTVAWLPPGSTVPESYGKEPFVLEVRELRGIVSNGMLASPKELALGESHDGILELDSDKQPGVSFADAYDLNDHIIEVENKMFTHRPDCFGELGIAREIAGISGRQFSSPGWYKNSLGQLSKTSDDSLPLRLENELPGLVPRFMAVALSKVTIKPSPVQLQSYLARVGIRPINNVVDITNFMMMLTGQPLHAYDYDKVAKLSDGDQATIVVRNPRQSETLTLLNGKTIEPRSDGIMIATNKQLIGVGGVMGGADTEVDDNTKNIILEVATFDMYSIRRTAMAHGLFTDAVTRFNKGQSPLQNDRVLQEAVRMLTELADAAVASDLIDDNRAEGRNWVHPPVPVTTSFINARLGLDLSADTMLRLLENVECSVHIHDGELTVIAPFWRTDIETREDVVEEVGRLYGFDKLPLVLPERSIVPAEKDGQLLLKSELREQLVKSGANEVLTYSFVHGNLLDKVGQNKDTAFKLSNALSPDLQYYRLSILPSLLDKLHANAKAGYDDFALFELGKAHENNQNDEHDLPVEYDNLAFVCTSVRGEAGGAAYYRARAYLCTLAAHFGRELEFRPLTEHVAPADAPFDLARTAIVAFKGEAEGFGIVGEFTASVRKHLKLPQATAGFELGIHAFQTPTETGSHYTPLPRFPKVTQDITLKVSQQTSYSAVWQCVNDAIIAGRPEQTSSSLTPLSIYQKAEDIDHKQITLRLHLASYTKTMTDGEVAAILDAAASAAHDKLGAERI